MSRRDPQVTLRQMRDHAREARDLVAGRSKTDFDILWQILQKDLPVLISELDRILARHP